MKPTQAKPVKKRRRWLIVAVVLVLMSLVSWWYWPRGDARFVGKWRMIDDSGADLGGELQLRSNGVWYWVNKSSGITLWTVWSAKGDQFQGGTSRDALGATWLQKLSEVVSKGRNRKLVLGYCDRYKIEFASHDLVQLVRETDGRRFKLTRLPE